MSVQLVSATWVLPVSQEPLRDGAVLVEGPRIVAVGPRIELAAVCPPHAERRHFEGATLMPGLVNAHTHLALTCLGDTVEPMPFIEWLPRIVSEKRSRTAAELAASAAEGAQQLLDAGVTTIADIAYEPGEIGAIIEAGLSGVFCTEILGVSAGDLDAALAHAGFPAEIVQASSAHISLGLSPHSPYTSGPLLLRAVHDRAASLGIPFVIHAAESAAETELIAEGSGPLMVAAEKLADGFEPTGDTTVSYLGRLGVLGDATLIHLGEASDADIELLGNAGVRGVVTCPRSNHYLGNPVANVPALLAHGIAVGIGTDSTASNEDLDLMADVRALAAEHPSLDARALIDIATRQGAQAIGLREHSNALEPGSPADIAVFGVAGDDPEAEVVERAGAASLTALMAGGAWRR